jgi:2'-5' RNA ligase
MRSPRYAIAYTPLPSSPLARFGASVLGYDCFDRVDMPRLMVHRLDPAVLALATVEPRRCGFQATLVAPFRLNGSHQDDVVAAVDRFARRHAPVPIGLLEAAPVGGYVALVPVQPDPGIATLAAACLKDFDRFSAPLTPAEQERHKATGLTERQVQLLQRWGYPYVLDQFRFHMRLAGPLSARELELFTALLSNSFASLAGDHFEVDAISLMRQDDVEKRFFVVARQRLTGP